MPEQRGAETWEVLLEQLRSEFEVRELELELLHEIDLRILDHSQRLEDTLDFVTRETKGLLRAAAAGILLRRGEQLEYPESPSGIGKGAPFRTAESPFEPCVAERAPVLISRDDESYNSQGASLESVLGPWTALLAVPVALGETHTVLGILYATRNGGAPFDVAETKIAKGVAAQLAIAMENAELFDQGRLFESVDQLIFSQESTKQVLQQALDEVFVELMRLDSGVAAQILFPRDEANTLEIVSSTTRTDVGVTVATDDSVSGRALRSRSTVVVNDVNEDPEYKRMLGAEIASEIAVPIVIGADQVVIGILNVESAEPSAFGGLYQLLIERFARKVTMLLAFTKLRQDMAGALEIRHANDLLVAVGDQTSNMVHRLNNTVGAMRVRVEEIEQNCSAEVASSSFLRDSLAYLAEKAEETLEMPRRIQRFLAQTSELAAIDVNECVAEVLGRMRFPVKVEQRVNLAAGIPRVECFSLDLVIENLVRNAIEAMPEGGELSIETNLTRFPKLASARVDIAISDTGAGMSEATRRKLFDIDFTTKPRKEGKGLGIGLWWVKYWVHRSDGDIDVSSVEGAGTTMVVRLPVNVGVGM